MDFDLSTGLLALHVFVGALFIGLGVQNLLAGRPLGLVLQGFMGVLIIGLGVGASRLVGSPETN
ncbi:hypothetical protein ACFR9U_08690 [Halorientalis brevis]|uniref:Uncharacterized protein n=1 Tax=Halorientalis brevis TaxID=1126241 RepID=A0ABD6CAC0_9EURY|nr:hypothetical protein [Halorientalis brevis]